MKKKLCVLLSLVLCIGLLAGCSSGSDAGKGANQGQENGGTGNSDTDGGEGTGGGGDSNGEPVELTIGMGAQITTLDPGLTTETINNYVLKHTVSCLFKKDGSGNVVEELADSYTVSEDGLTYTVKLKEGLTWSDGEPLTAKDFVYAVNRNLTYGAENAWAVYNLATYLQGAAEHESDSSVDLSTFEFAGVEAPDDTTVVYHLVKPCAFFTGLLGSYVFAPLRADFAEAGSSEWAVNPGYPSCGPFVLDYCNENEKAVVVKNSSYYDAANVTVDQITFMVMPDADAEAAAFQTGELDVALSINTSLVETYDNPDELWTLPQISSYFIAMNSGSAGPEVLKDVNVRRALALAIDKEQLVSVIGTSDYYQALYGYVPVGLQGAEGDFRQESDAKEKFLDYDLEEAKNLLAQAGYGESNPLKIKYKYSNSTLHGDVAQILQQMWKEAGIEAELEVVESGVFYDQLDNGNFEIARYGYSANNDPSEYFALWTTGQQIVAAVDDPAYDKMVDEVGYIVDRTEYMNELHAIERYLVEENVYLIPLFNYNTPALKRTNISNVIVAPGDTPSYSYVVIE